MSDLTNSGNPGNANSSFPAQQPVIQLNGANPAHVRVGATYQDLGATITVPKADLNLGLKYFLNGQLVSNIVLDTSAIATDTIDYVVTDPTGLAATSTRTIIIDAPDASSSLPSSTPLDHPRLQCDHDPPSQFTGDDHKQLN